MLWLAATLPLFTPTAEAGSRWLQNDVFTGEGSAYIVARMGTDECVASLFETDPSEYPFTFNKVQVLLLAEGDKSLTANFAVEFWSMETQSFGGALQLDEEVAQFTSSSSAYNEVTVADLEVDLPELSSAYVAVALCNAEHEGDPVVANDASLSGDTAKSKTNWIYTGGKWQDATTLGVTSNFIIRACIEGDSVANEGCDSGEGDSDADGDADSDTDSDSDADSDLALLTVTPGSAVEGEAVSVVLLGQGFTDAAEARIGGIPLTGQALVNGETLTGRTPTTLPAGTHDVEVVQDGESAILIGAFTVEGGKLCAARSGSASALAAGLALVMGMLTRRRKSSRA
jgi:hypothetical protein